MTKNKMITLAAAAVTLLTACGAQTTAKTSDDNSDNNTSTTVKSTQAVQYDCRIIAAYPHSTESYTQGLEWVDGVMWEGTGHEGDSHLQRIDLRTGKRNIVASLPKSEFGEGITHSKDRIYQLTWTEEKAYVYDLNGKKIKTIKYEGEGWGITTDGERLFMSDGTPRIRIVDAETFDTIEIINVTLNNTSLDLINELEWVDGRIWANVYLHDIIVEIDPATGAVTGFVDLAMLRTLLEDNPQAEVLNGIAYNSTTEHFYVTGKDWNRLFEIEILRP